MVRNLCPGIKSLNLDHCASHLGKAIGLTNFLRGLPYNSQRRRVLVPQELMIKHKVSQENFVRLDEPTKIYDVVYDIASSAHLHYQKVIKPQFKTLIPFTKMTLAII